MHDISRAEIAIRRGTIPIRNGSEFICYACCEQMQMCFVEGLVVADCPDHLQIVLDNGKVVKTLTRGVRS